ncbi:MAG TPA: hypothetical protein VG371_01320 [Solirubrobacteraceae bacterium]|nr:hypothetical protein [Solirubrobacteraceae bacterium]
MEHVDDRAQHGGTPHPQELDPRSFNAHATHTPTPQPDPQTGRSGDRLLIALAITLPVAEASAATLHASTPSSVVTGPTLSGDVFNGSTLVITSRSAASGTVNAPMN